MGMVMEEAGKYLYYRALNLRSQLGKTAMKKKKTTHLSCEKAK